MATTNLDYLHEYSSNDKDFVIEMVELFLSSTPGFLEEMKDAFEQGNYETVAKISHKMKPSMTFMGIKNGKELTIELEEIAQEGSGTDKIKSKMEELIKLCESAFEELKVSLEKLKA